MVVDRVQGQAASSPPPARRRGRRSAETVVYQGEEYPVYDVPTADGTRSLGARRAGPRAERVHRPGAPERGLIEWEGRWRTLEQSLALLALDLDNFATVWKPLDFPRLLFNTFVIAVLGTIGAVLSSICVAYGFSRFRFPGGTASSCILLATIILPFQVTLIPTYAVFAALGWIGTWLPLIVPHFFANAYNVFLLRQYFLTIPRDLDEAAMIDGAGPFRILRSVIVPQAMAAIVAVALFHFFFAWNDFFLPLIYLQGKPELQPLSVGIPQFNALVRDPADADPGGGAHDDGRAGHRLLPGPARVHARRRHHRGREVTERG